VGRKEIRTESKLRQPGRRAVLKAGLAIAPAASMVTAQAQWRYGGTGNSPPTTPFLEPMPLMPILPQRQLTDAAFARTPTVTPNRSLNPSTGLPYIHTHCRVASSKLAPPTKFDIRIASRRFSPTPISAPWRPLRSSHFVQRKSKGNSVCPPCQNFQHPLHLIQVSCLSNLIRDQIPCLTLLKK